MTNTLLPAMELLIKEGMKQDSPMKIAKALKEVRRDSRRFNWNDDTIETLPVEWQWRICTARLQQGILDWRGWIWRTPRAGHDPFDIPRWKAGIPVYPVIQEPREPEHVKSLLIYSEQGIGDQIMFAQALKYVRPFADEITLEIEPRLAPIFERSFPWLTVHPLKDLRDGSWVKPGQFDAKILMGDVVARFIRDKCAMEQKPYLKPDPEKVYQWENWLSTHVDKPWIGFSWAGRQGYVDPCLCDKGWINLQYGKYVPTSEMITPPGIDLKEDIEDVFAIVSLLDRVVCVPNTLAHIAGSLGVPCDVISILGTGEINNGINYRWGMPGQRKMPWHPSITIFRSVKDWRLNREPL